MKLIADAGGTKSDWALLDKNHEEIISISGLNPNIISFREIEQIIRNELLSYLEAEKINSVSFYGAGLSVENYKDKMSEILQEIFKNAEISVNHDLLGAARSLCFNQAGIIGILGTGSSVCLYDGEKIIETLGGHGYLFGDEGSGAHFGKVLLTRMLNNEISKQITKSFEEEQQKPIKEFRNEIYESKFPNRELAKLSKFIHENIEHIEIQAIVKKSLQTFFELSIKKIPNYKSFQLYFNGSIAHYFSIFLKEIATNEKLEIAKIQIKPIEKLIEFHKNHTL